MDMNVVNQGYVCCEHDYAIHMRAICRPRHWRTLLDPRDPDYVGPDDEEWDEDEAKMRQEDAAEDRYIESRQGRDELADLAEDRWMKNRRVI